MKTDDETVQLYGKDKQGNRTGVRVTVQFWVRSYRIGNYRQGEWYAAGEIKVPRVIEIIRFEGYFTSNRTRKMKVYRYFNRLA